MDIIKEIFAKSSLIKESLLNYGFSLKESRYVYEKSFFDDQFLAVITIDKDGVISGKVIDKEMNEEYYQINVESFNGGFVGSVREAYKEILIDIRNKCFKSQIYISPQANRISKLIKERYNEDPDFPFDKLENYGVYRYPKNKKWYGLIMNIKRSQLLHDDSNDFIDVINIKLSEEIMSEALKIYGIFPAYHMNRSYWASIMLDDTLDDEAVMKYINYSRDIIMNNTKKKKTSK